VAVQFITKGMKRDVNSMDVDMQRYREFDSNCISKCIHKCYFVQDREVLERRPFRVPYTVQSGVSETRR